MLTYLILRIFLVIKFNPPNTLILSYDHCHTPFSYFSCQLSYYHTRLSCIEVYNILMIVPDFKLKQNDTHIIVYIRVPYIKVGACEFYIQSDTFKFFLKPYLLSLAFQHPLKEVEEPSKAIYYHEKYTLEVHLEKLNAGEHFNNLDLLTNILNNKKKKKNKVKVEVINSQNSQLLVQEQPGKVNVYNYGFGLNYSDVLDNLDEQTNELFEFDPRSITLPQRLPMSEQILIKQFDYDSYLYDKYDNKQQILSLISDPEVMEHIEQQLQQRQGSSINSGQFRLKMKGKELLLSKELEDNVWTEIVSIVFSYVYELVCIGGEFGVESAKTINRTSLILSCHSYYHGMTLMQVLINCCKRCMTYSLYKSLLLCKHTLSILPKFIHQKYLISVLLDIKQLFQSSEPRYLLNQLFIDDYLLFLYASEKDDRLESIRKEIADIKIKEEDMDLKIKEYEYMQVEQQPQIEQKIEEIKPEPETSSQQKQTADLAAQFDKLNTLD